MTFKPLGDVFKIDQEAWEDGRFAGYFGKAKVNPFRRGWGEVHTLAQLTAAVSWEQGFEFGEADYWRDLAHEKHKED